MINRNEIIVKLNNQFEKVEKLHIEHKNRVLKAIDWFNNAIIDKSTNKISGSRIKLNDIEALCIENSFEGAPFFVCYFVFMPYNVTDDLGSGCGIRHKVEF